MIMKKNLLLLALATCLGVFTSCGNKIDNNINKLEKIVSKMEKTDDPAKLQTMFEETLSIFSTLDTIDAKSVTKEQEERFTKIGLKLEKLVNSGKLENVLKGSLGIASDAMNILGSAVEKDIEEEINISKDELNDADQSLNSIFDNEDE